MKSKKRLKLAIVMIICAILVSFAIATTDYLRQKSFTIENHERTLNQTADIVENSIRSVEKAYALFDKEASRVMQSNMDYLLNQYDQQHDFEEWDFHQLQEMLGMDIYIINEKNVITHSNVTADINLDFEACCQSLAKVLDVRRSTGEFYEDGMEIEQETGMIKKYSYMATPDKKYIIELGLNLENGEVFQAFNFLDVTDELLKSHPSINEINILHNGGLVFGKTAAESKLSNERMSALKQSIEENSKIEFSGEWKSEFAIYRYLPYVSNFETGVSKNKAIEIIYNDRELQSILKENREIFFFQLISVLLIISVISFVIHQWVKKQVYLAYHDNLTKLKNRTAFEEYIENELGKNKDTMTGIMMIDLDNFKLVNDYLGHDKGDYLLYTVAQTIKESVKAKGEVFRLGGDEFVAIIPSTTVDEIEEVAEQIIYSLEKSIKLQKELTGFNITASIGICFSPQHSSYSDTLYKKADIALYHAKEKGKNQYCIYDENLLRHNENMIL
ncbi:diguanylate cyclase domain-containing protein [Oceanobacillus sp. CAU 1775]